MLRRGKVSVPLAAAWSRSVVQPAGVSDRTVTNTNAFKLGLDSLTSYNKNYIREQSARTEHWTAREFRCCCTAECREVSFSSTGQKTRFVYLSGEQSPGSAFLKLVLIFSTAAQSFSVCWIRAEEHVPFCRLSADWKVSAQKHEAAAEFLRFFHTLWYFSTWSSVVLYLGGLIDPKVLVDTGAVNKMYYCYAAISVAESFRRANRHKRQHLDSNGTEPLLASLETPVFTQSFWPN